MLFWEVQANDNFAFAYSTSRAASDPNVPRITLNTSGEHGGLLRGVVYLLSDPNVPRIVLNTSGNIVGSYAVWYIGSQTQMFPESV